MWLRTWPAIAAAARRTPGKVKSAAITPRQPEVPKWIAWLATRGYCILARMRLAAKKLAAASGKSKGDAEVAARGEYVVLVTCGSRAEADKVGRALVKARLAACVNVLGNPVRSIYQWKGRVETAKEFLLVIKTSRRRFVALRRAVKRLHSYDVPEIIALRIAEGSAAYLRWLEESVGRQRKRKRRRK